MATCYAKEYRAAYGGTRPDPDEVCGQYDHCKTHGSIGEETWIYRSFLWYDLSKIPYKSKITSAKLWVYCFYHNDYAANALHNFSRVTEAWDEKTLTWNNLPTVASELCCDEWQAAPALNSWASWDITPMVQEWVNLEYPNYGLQIVNQSESGIWRLDWFFYNRRHSGGQYATYIEIEYEPEEEIRITKTRMTEIADAIRVKTGKTDALTLAQMVTEIEGIILQEKTIVPSSEQQEIIPDDGYYGLSKVVVIGTTDRVLATNEKAYQFASSQCACNGDNIIVKNISSIMS